MYYAMGHFSKYVPEDSVRIGLTMADDKKLFASGNLHTLFFNNVVVNNLL